MATEPRPASKGVFRLAHISDVHLGPMPDVRKRELMSKRLTGYVNWQRNRARIMQDSVLEDLLASMKSQAPDHIIVSGDLVNLALDSEIDRMVEWLAALGPPDKVSVVPGNHDTYVAGALRHIRRKWQPYMSGDGHVAQSAVFPYTRIRGCAAIIGVNSGRATAPLMATGSFRGIQANALRDELDDQAAKHFRVVVIHHPPFENATLWHKRLVGAGRFREVINHSGAELILHGHTHRATFNTIDGMDRPVPIVGVAAASQAPLADATLAHGKPAARYNLFDISDSTGGWNCHWQEFGFMHGESGIRHLSSRTIWRDGQFEAEKNI